VNAEAASDRDRDGHRAEMAEMAEVAEVVGGAPSTL
jgi:hypothetical protein